jgi:hypothetical protein
LSMKRRRSDCGKSSSTSFRTSCPSWADLTVVETVVLTASAEGIEDRCVNTAGQNTDATGHRARGTSLGQYRLLTYRITVSRRPRTTATNQAHTSRLVSGCGRRIDFVFADEMQFPSPLCLVVDSTNLL